jgi:hypothetical protein
MTFDPNAAVIACLAALALVSLVDGVYVHLVRERLHRRPEARMEHLSRQAPETAQIWTGRMGQEFASGGGQQR